MDPVYSSATKSNIDAYKALWAKVFSKTIAQEDVKYQSLFEVQKRDFLEDSVIEYPLGVLLNKIIIRDKDLMYNSLIESFNESFNKPSLIHPFIHNNKCSVKVSSFGKKFGRSSLSKKTSKDFFRIYPKSNLTSEKDTIDIISLIIYCELISNYKDTVIKKYELNENAFTVSGPKKQESKIIGEDAGESGTDSQTETESNFKRYHEDIVLRKQILNSLRKLALNNYQDDINIGSSITKPETEFNKHSLFESVLKNKDRNFFGKLTDKVTNLFTKSETTQLTIEQKK